MSRAACLGLAALILGVAYLAPWSRWFGFFPAHMVQHMTLVALAAPLLVLGLRMRWRVPVLAGAAAEFVVVWGWHLPAFHGLACYSTGWTLVEQASFLAVGLLVWQGALAADDALLGAMGLLLTSMHMTLLGALLTLAPAPIYAATCPICGALGAQQLGGILMLAIGTPVYLLGGLWLIGRAMGSDTKDLRHETA